MSSTRRIQKEIKDLEGKLPEGVLEVTQDGFDIFHWFAVIEGPKGTPYEGGKFQLAISLPTAYPFKPPSFKFITPILHQNISSTNGQPFLEMIEQFSWSPAFTVSKALQSLVSQFNLDFFSSECVLNQEAFRMMSTDKNKFIEAIKEHVKKHATN